MSEPSLHIHYASHDGTSRCDLQVSPLGAMSKFMASGETVQTLSCILIYGRLSWTSKVFVALLSLHFPSSRAIHPVASSRDPPSGPEVVYCCCNEAIVAAAGPLAD